MKNFHIGLLPRIIIAIILGILFGNFLPASLVRLFVTFNAIFSEFLNFSIPLIIVGLVTIAIADIGKGAGRMLVVTALIAYGATLFSGFLSYFTGMAVFPSLIETGVPLEEVSESQGILPYFSVGIPPLMNVMTALVLAFTLGLGLAHLKSEVLKNAARDFQEIVIRMISAVILPLLPIYIFGIFLNMTHSGQDYRCNLPASHLSPGIPIQHCGTVCPQEPSQTTGTNDACLLHGSRHSIQCRHYPCNIGAKSEERRLCRYCRIRHPTLRHHPSVGQHIEDCGMRPGTDDNARHAP